MAKEDVEVALDGGRIALFRDGELGTEGGAFNRASRGVPLAESRRPGGEVSVELPLRQAGISRASLCERNQSVSYSPCPDRTRHELFSGLQLV